MKSTQNKLSKHGMSSEQASEKKKGGHNREELRAEILGPETIILTGVTKPDLVRPDGLSESVKGGKKTQFALYTLNRIISDNTFSKKQYEKFIDWVNFIPDNKKEWEKNRILYKKNVKVIELFNEFVNHPMKLVNYFCGKNQIDFLSILDSRNNEWLTIKMSDFLKKIEKEIKNVYYTKSGSLVISGGKKNLILFVMELRKGKSHHKKILFHSNLHRIIDCIN